MNASDEDRFSSIPEEDQSMMLLENDSEYGEIEGMLPIDPEADPEEKFKKARTAQKDLKLR